MTAPPKLLSVTILGGFLGAGKTTLLSHVLTTARGVRIGVLVNDFGQVSLDAALISEITSDVIRLTNGCICCSIKDEVTKALFRLIDQHTLDHVIIETSGLSDPRAVRQAFLELHKNFVIRLDGLVTVVDAAGFEKTRAEHRALAEAQIECADVLVLSKTDLVTAEQTAELERTLRALRPEARLVRATEGRVALDVVLAIDASPDDQAPVHTLGTEGFESWTFREPRPMRWLELAPKLVHLPPEVLRVKGLLNLAERPGDRILLHVVGGRVHVRTLSAWTGAPLTELVLIGTPHDHAALADLLRACV